MSDVDTWLAEATPDEVTVKLTFDRRLSAEYLAAVEELVALREQDVGRTLDGADVLKAASAKAVELEEKLVASERPFTFRCIEWERWSELAKAHPPTDEQVAAQREQNEQMPPEARVPLDALVNAETFYPALLAEACTSPGLTVAQAVKIRSVLPREAWDELVTTVQTLNVRGSAIPKSVRGIAETLSGVLSSTMPRPEASRSASSEGGSSERTTLDG